LLVNRPARGILKHLFQEFHEMLQSGLVTCLPSQILDSAVFLARVSLLLQREDSMGQPVGGHADSSEAVPFKRFILLVKAAT
jgi:hypothetical protein